MATVREPRAREKVRRAPRLRGRLLVAGVLCVTAIAGVLALLGRPYRGALPPDTRVGGIELGGRSDADAARLLAASAQPVIRKGMVLTSGSDRFPVSLARIRIAPDTADALHRARNVGFVGRIRARLGVGDSRDLDLRYRFDDQALARALRPARRAVEVAPVEAGVKVGQNGSLKVVRGKGGILIDRVALAASLHQLPRLGGRLELPLRRVRPSADNASAQRALAAATTLLTTPHQVVLLGHGYRIRRDALAKALDFAPEGGEVRLKLTRPAIRAEMHRLFGTAEVQPRNARFAVGSTGGVEIVDSSVGREVDADTVRQALEQDPAMERIPVRIADIKPGFATSDAKRLGITDLVGEFTTPYDPGAPRVTNIQRAAEVLDGFILKPGDTFSLNAALGPRTIESGYVLAPQIEEGKLKDAVGGGVSQVATTLYNAAFMSGLRLVAHTPHEFWISRYPRGREATVSWGGPELVFTNTWDAPLVMLLDAGDSSITVRFFSRSLKRRVEYGTDDPTDFKDPSERKIVNLELKPGEQRVLQESGSPGFAISYWRKVYKGDDLVANETWTTRYKPEDRILEVGPKPPKPPKPTGTSEPPATTGGGGGTSTGGGDTTPGGQDQPPTGQDAPPTTT